MMHPKVSSERRTILLDTLNITSCHTTHSLCARKKGDILKDTRLRNISLEPVCFYFLLSKRLRNATLSRTSSQWNGRAEAAAGARALVPPPPTRSEKGPAGLPIWRPQCVSDPPQHIVYLTFLSSCLCLLFKQPPLLVDVICTCPPSPQERERERDSFEDGVAECELRIRCCRPEGKHSEGKKICGKTAT